MGRIGTVLAWAARTYSGWVKNDPGGGANIQSTLFNDAGVDAPPLPGDSVASFPTRRGGGYAAVGSVDTKNASTAAAGERRQYARDSSGTIVSQVYQNASGEVIISNDNGFLSLQADGKVNINGVIFDTHTHLQGTDSAGNTEQPVAPPTNPVP